MKYLVPILKMGLVLTLVAWFTGCGLNTSNAQKDLLTIEVEQQEEEIQALKALTDTLTTIRTQLLGDINNLQELNNLTPEQVAVLEAETPEPQVSTLAKIGSGLKKLWPF